MTHNVLIIGAGVSGLSVAVSLLQRGCAVTLLERGSIGGESSWAGGGILSPLLPWEYSDPVTSLALYGMQKYSAWLDGIEKIGGVEAELWRCGMLAFDIAESERALIWCEEHGLLATLVKGSHRTLTRNLLTAQNTLYLPEIAQVRNPRLIAALRAAIIQSGGSLIENCAVTGIDTQKRRVVSIRSSTKKWEADSVIMAAGAWAGIGLSALNPAPHIRPIRGQMLLFKLEPGMLDTIIYRHGLYLIPRRDGHILVGSTLEDVGFDKSTDLPTRQRLHAEAAEILPILNSVEPIQHWSGLRPGSPDNIPIIGRHPDFDNVFINAGHYRYGVTMAPASAELLVDLMEGKKPVLDPAPYSWEAALARQWGDTL